MVGRDRAAWNNLLGWASLEATFPEVQAGFFYLAAGIARTARHVPPMPDLDVQRLTFPKVAALIDDLLDLPSGGAYHQFAFAALLHARVATDERLRVTTKSLNASDASSRVPGDVQLVDRQEVIEAYEVTANEWHTKLRQADAARKDRDLRRAHVLAAADQATAEQIMAELEGQGIDANADVSVLDCRHELRSMLAALSKVRRRDALERLHTYLVQYQSNDQLVRSFVERLHARELTVASA